MFVAQVRQMSNAEMVGWRIYYAKKAQREELEAAKAKARGGR